MGSWPYSYGPLTPPNSGRIRSVPMVEQVATVLGKLGRRERFTDDEDLVFAGITGDRLGGPALRRRYKEAIARAGLAPIKFHDLRHSFGCVTINRANLVDVKEWLGHADIQTTARYLHYKSRADEAELLAEVFPVADSIPPPVSPNAHFGPN